MTTTAHAEARTQPAEDHRDERTTVHSPEHRLEPSDGDSHLSLVPPIPTLHGEWRVRIDAISGGHWYVPVDDHAAALELGQRLREVRWTIEHRLVAPWQQVGKTRRTLLVIEELDPINDEPDELEAPVENTTRVAVTEGE